MLSPDHQHGGGPAAGGADAPARRAGRPRRRPRPRMPPVASTTTVTTPATRRRRGHPGPPAAEQPALTDRPLDQVEGGGGHGHRHRHPDPEERVAGQARCAGRRSTGTAGSATGTGRRRCARGSAGARPTGPGPATTLGADHAGQRRPPSDSAASRKPPCQRNGPSRRSGHHRSPVAAIPAAPERPTGRRAQPPEAARGRVPPDEAIRRARRPTPPGEDGQPDGQGGADQEALAVGVGPVVQPGVLGPGRGRAAPSRPPRPGRRRRTPPAAPTGDGSSVRTAEHHQRPHQVELLLDGQRPGVGEQRRQARSGRSSWCPSG